VSIPLLELRNLHAEADGASILRGVDLTVGEGEVHALMGPNGAGKSTLANVVMGHPGYTSPTARYCCAVRTSPPGRPTCERAPGIFLAFQYPEAISGVSVIQFLRQAIAARKGFDELSVLEVRLDLAEWMDRLGIDPPSPSVTSTTDSPAANASATRSCRWRSLNRSSRSSTRPTRASTSTPCASSPRACARCANNTPLWASVVVTHYVKLLDEIEPDYVHVSGRRSDRALRDAELAREIDRRRATTPGDR
jgi:Fe-S cluster assembly ATP-binding protein